VSLLVFIIVVMFVVFSEWCGVGWRERGRVCDGVVVDAELGLEVLLLVLRSVVGSAPRD
jgi:hypothetical protein